jgi:hypothetical protein
LGVGACSSGCGARAAPVFQSAAGDRRVAAQRALARYPKVLVHKGGARGDFATFNLHIQGQDFLLFIVI